MEQPLPTVQEVEDVPRKRMARAAVLPALVVLLLWVVHLLNVGLELGLHRWGVLPRTLAGLPGILFSPFIHGDFEHLFNNSVPLFLLGWSLIYFYPRKAGNVVLVTWLVSGIWVWISARGNYHIGASGVVYGLVAFMFFSGVLRKQRTLMALSMLVVFLYGSMVWGVLPIVPRISWESHLWGGLSGVLMAVLYRKVPPAVQDPPRIVHDDDDEDEEGEEMHPLEAPKTIQSMRIVYHSEHGEVQVVDPDSQSRTTEESGHSMDPMRTSGTWSGKEGPSA